MTRIPVFQPTRQFSLEEKQQIVADKRTSAVLAILWGVTPHRIRSIRMQMSKRFADKN